MAVQRRIDVRTRPEGFDMDRGFGRWLAVALNHLAIKIDKQHAIGRQFGAAIGAPLNHQRITIRHADGAVSVLGAPYLVAQPQVTFDPEPGAPLSGPDAEEITKLVTRFLRAYASSARSGDLVYFVAPGFEVTPLGGFDLANDPAIGQLGDEETERTVTASARFKDKATGTVYPLRYRLDLVKRKRWFVADVQGVI